MGSAKIIPSPQKYQSRILPTTPIKHLLPTPLTPRREWPRFKMDESMSATPIKEEDRTPDEGGPSIFAGPADPATPMQGPSQPQVATVPHPMLTPICDRMHEMEARLRELKQSAPNAITQQQADACMQQLATRFSKCRQCPRKLPGALTSRFSTILLRSRSRSTPLREITPPTSAKC